MARQQPKGTHDPTLALALAVAARQAQVQARNQMVRDVLRLWPLLDFRNQGGTWPGWLAAMSTLLNRYHSRLATDAGLFYRGMRQLELGEPGTAVLADLPSPEWQSAALGFAGPGTYNNNVSKGVPEQEARKTALSVVVGTSARIAMDGARTTVVESAKFDDRPVRFYRITDDDPCAFCALMASRGAVYHSAQAAGEMNSYHNDCACTVAPAFTRRHELTGIAAEASDIYANLPSGLSSPERLKAFRKAWNERQKAARTAAAA